jgi:Sulfatase
LRALTHPATVAFGLANLYLLALTGPLISTDHDLIYHLIGSASPIIIPIIVYVIILSFLLTAMLFLARRPGPLRIIIWSAFLLALPSILLHTFANFSSSDVPDWLSALVALGALLTLLAISICWKKFQPTFEKILPTAATILGVFSLSGLLIFGQLLWCAVQTLNLNPAPRLHHAESAVPVAPHGRIVWLVLDELSYQQLYERRFPGLDLPAFDQLAAQSTVFTHAVPTGEYTRFILPTLFTGLSANEIKVSSRGLLVSLHDPTSGEWIPFDQHQTVFQDALNAGYSTGLAGWYNPYCRIMPEVLDHCFWTYRESTPANLSPNRSLAVDILRPFHYLLLDAKHLFGHGPGSPSEEAHDIRQHSTDYRKLLAAGDAYLADPSINFLFLHMPIPHPYGFYDRKKKSFSTRHTSYIDNLALCDQYLAHIRLLLDQQHQWDSTTLIIMGDHGWRTKLIWVDSATWTDEDAAASHNGEFDDRPAYIVKLPGQETPSRIDEPFPLRHTRALLDSLLQNRLQTAADLQDWVMKQK